MMILFFQLPLLTILLSMAIVIASAIPTSQIGIAIVHLQGVGSQSNIKS